MLHKIWAYALAIAAVAAGCGGGPGSNPSGGNAGAGAAGSGSGGGGGGGAAGGGALYTLPFEVEAGGLPTIGQTPVYVVDGKTEIQWGTVAEYSSKPYQSDCVGGIEFKLKLTGYMYDSVPWLIKLTDCQKSQLKTRGVVGRDITDGQWKCTRTTFEDGIKVAAQTWSGKFGCMVSADTTLAYACSYLGSTLGIALVGDTISSASGAGKVSPDGASLDYGDPSGKPGYADKVNCVRQ